MKHENSAKIQYLLNLLSTSQTLENIEQLALITKVRQEMSSKDTAPNIKDVILNTNILSIIQQILSFQDNSHEIIRYLKLEATWILTNIGYGDEDDILAVFDKKYGLSQHINLILQGKDLQMIDQCIWLCANTAGESLKLRNMILSEIFIIDAMTRIINEAQKSKAKVLKGMIANMMWCVSNLSRSKTVDQTSAMVSIT